jgi:osmotically-inducible protein OsmY
MVVQPSVPISYAAVAKFEVTPVSGPQLQTDISGMIARAGSQLSNASGLQVHTEGNVVTLRGTVKDIEEARLVEGMVRLTPGVGLIRNELTFPIK